jgi:hypothetical protein
MVCLIEARATSMRGTDAVRKRTSSVMGPLIYGVSLPRALAGERLAGGHDSLTATRFLQTVHSLNNSFQGRPLAHDLHPSSTTKYENSGPRNSSAVSPSTLIDALSSAGHRPIKCSTSRTVARGSCRRITYVVPQQTRQLMVTEVMRARITVGASRDKVALGRVRDEK